MTVLIILHSLIPVAVSLVSSISGCFSGRFPGLAEEIGGTGHVPHQSAVFYPVSWTHSALGGPVFSTPLDVWQWLEYYNSNNCPTGYCTGRMA